MGLMEKQSFDSDRKEVLDHALLTSWFTTDQCIRLMDFYRFDSEKKQLMKKIYPKIADKPNFYYAIDKLTFSSDKNEINAFIKHIMRRITKKRRDYETDYIYISCRYDEYSCL